ncbi:MAG: response regulator [Chloroflexi bacterium]|nr:response regulator [Chloroflexota bacterium]
MSVPETGFVDAVRDALLHLYDVGYLQKQPLLPLVGQPARGVAASGPRLRQALLDAIETLTPGPDVAETARAWRPHRILELRYIDCYDVAEVMEQVSLSSAQYHREHHRALAMLAVVLWEQWGAASRWPALASVAPSRVAADVDPVRQEAEGLLHDRRPGPVDIAQVVEEIRRLLPSLQAGRGAAFAFHVPADLPDVTAERVAVRQVLLVLLAHAGKAVTQGVIDVRLARQAQRVVITISGPSAGALAEPLEQGMSDCRPFVEALRGWMRFIAPATDTTVWSIEVELLAHQRPTLLVVDNSTDFVRLIEVYLTDTDWEVISATTVEDAMRIAHARNPEAVLLDVIIPDRDGWDLLFELRGQAATLAIPVIICSVLQEPDMALALGATAYLQKPVDQTQLLAALRPFH